MMLYLSRLTLNRDAGLSALASLLDPPEPGQAADAHHRLIWSLFADQPDRERDFLWRADGKGRFFALSARRPNPSPLFLPPEVKEFAPALSAGDLLAFKLRVNATKTRKTGQLTRNGKEHKTHDDVVMRMLHGRTGQRADMRMEVARTEASVWMNLQGTRAGFTLCDLVVEDYAVMALPGHVGKRKDQPQFGVLDLQGVIEVTEPAALLPALAKGFGRAKAFGCGLMLIRRG
ncbi:MAG: type I-E CRISPR-associated protein Cas6/Cse3/CasE [Rhodobacteraceae bacterium]|nr:type I-E CRISPR-associated protein Cas6/Cse3/CasE [Paracoccaceae bacterium]